MLAEHNPNLTQGWHSGRTETSRTSKSHRRSCQKGLHMTHSIECSSTAREHLFKQGCLMSDIPGKLRYLCHIIKWNRRPPLTPSQPPSPCVFPRTSRGDHTSPWEDEVHGDVPGAQRATPQPFPASDFSGSDSDHIKESSRCLWGGVPVPGSAQSAAVYSLGRQQPAA